jgi:hypothetical protein
MITHSLLPLEEKWFTEALSTAAAAMLRKKEML